MDNKEIYKKGFIDGLISHAHWLDGKQYVGTTGKDLKTAIVQIEDTWNYCPPKED